MVLVHLASGVRELDIVANINKKIICASCGQLSLDPHLMSCGNVLCPECLTSVSVRDYVCPCGTVCGHPFSFKNFELQVLNLMVRCPNFSSGCSALVPMRSVDAHLRKCELSQPLIRYPAHDIDVFKIVDNLADTVSVAIDLGYPMKFETVSPPPQQHRRRHWTPETPSPTQPGLQTPKRGQTPILAIEAPLRTPELQCQTEISEGANGRIETVSTDDGASSTQCPSEAKKSVAGSDSATVAHPITVASKAKNSQTVLGCDQTQSTDQKSNPNSPTDHATSKLKSHHRKMRENDTLYMDEGVLRLLESGVSGRTRGIQKSGFDSEKDIKKDTADARSGRLSPAVRRRSVSFSKKYSSMYNLKPCKIVIERIPDEVFQKHFPAEGELLGRVHAKAKESSQAREKCEVGSRDRPSSPGRSESLTAVGCEHSETSNTSTDTVPAPSPQKGALMENASPPSGTIEEIRTTKKLGTPIDAKECVRQQPPKFLSAGAKPTPPSGTVAHTAATATAMQIRTAAPNTPLLKAAKSGATATCSVPPSPSEPAAAAAAAQEQKNVKTVTAKGNHPHQRVAHSISAQKPVVRPVTSSIPSLVGETTKTLPNKSTAAKIVEKQLIVDGSKTLMSVPRKVKRVAPSSETMSNTTTTVRKTPAPATAPCGPPCVKLQGKPVPNTNAKNLPTTAPGGPAAKLQGKPVPNTNAKNLLTTAGAARKIMATKTESGTKKSETSSTNPLSFKIPRKSTATVGVAGDPSASTGACVVEQRSAEDLQAPQDQRKSLGMKRPFLTNPHSQTIEAERKRARIEERRSSAHTLSHTVPPERRHSSGSAKSEKHTLPHCPENSPKPTELRASSVSVESEPSSESERLTAMNVPVNIPLEPQVAVKESIPQPVLHRFVERPVLELGLFSKKIWDDQVPPDISRCTEHRDERSSLSPPLQPPPPPPSLVVGAFSSPSMPLTSPVVFAKRHPFDVRCQQFTEPSQLTNPMQQNNPPWRDSGSTTIVKTDPRRCLDPRSGAVAAAAAAQKSAPPFAPGGHGTIVYQRGHLSTSWLGDAVLETSSFWSSHS